MNLFVAHTPYHIVLSTLLASCEHDNNFLIIVNDFEHADIYKKIFSLWKKNPFKKVEAFSSIYKNNFFVKYLNKIVNSRRMKKLVKNYDFKRVYIFNDQSLESQAAANFSYKVNNYVTLIYVEDGLAVYVKNLNFESNKFSENKYKKNIFKKKINKFLFGFEYMYYKSQVSMPGIKKLFVTSPELLDKNLFNKFKIEKINLEKLHDIFDFNFLRLIEEEYNFYFKSLLNIDLIIFLPHSELLKDNKYKKLIMEVLKKYNNKNLAVKCHPRDKNFCSSKFNIFDGKYNILEIPQSVPSEFIALYLSKNNIFPEIIGFVSTSLYTSKVLLPLSNVYLIRQSNVDEQLYSKMEKIGLKMIFE